MDKLEEYLERAKKERAMHERNGATGIVEAIDRIFPNLFDDKDERIRKELLDFVKDAKQSLELQERDNNKWQIEQLEMYIAWIEKQGKQENENRWHKVEDSLPDNNREVLCKDAIGKFFIGRYYNDGDYWEVSMYDEPDKSNKDNPPVIMWTNISLCGQILAYSAKTFKDEPKFKVGDWVRAISSGNIFKILSVNDGLYRVLCYDGVEANYPIEVEKDLAYWTIQDAKDGDVLSFNDGHGNDSIELIKSITDKKIEFWFCLTNGNRYEVFDGITPYTNLVSREDATPATKEQCDQLEKAMADAGYRWNPDEKKMEKVEQNPAWSEKNEAILDALIRRFEGEDILVSPHLAVECLKTLKERYTWKPTEQQLYDMEYIMTHYPNIRGMVESIYNELKKL